MNIVIIKLHSFIFHYSLFHFGEVRRAQLAKTVLLTSTLEPLGSFQICSDAKESGMRKATGSYRTYSVFSKTALLVSEFAVEDLPSAKLKPRFWRLQ